MIFGSAFHKGIETALRMAAMGRHTTEQYVAGAIRDARKYIIETTPSGLTTRDAKGNVIPDQDYYIAIEDVKQGVAELLRYHIKVLGFGSHFHDRFIVPTISDLAQGGPPVTGPAFMSEPLIEYHFEYPLTGSIMLSGYVDAILWDIELQQYVIYDWKTRTQFPFDQYAELDGQLHLYAAIINRLFPAADIREVRMYQMLTKPPQPASISKKTGVPNTGAATYNTTWEVWCATLPKGLRPEQYADVMEGKLKTDEDYYRVIALPITEFSSQEAIDNAVYISEMMDGSFRGNLGLPAVLSSHACKFCDFAMLCGGALRYGGDVSSVLTEHFVPRKIDSIEDEITEE